jgi:hypothetical protein
MTSGQGLGTTDKEQALKFAQVLDSELADVLAARDASSAREKCAGGDGPLAAPASQPTGNIGDGEEVTDAEAWDTKIPSVLSKFNRHS